MFGSVTDLPRFHNFQDAVSFYNNTKGIRGRENIKPLKSTRRSPDSYRIEAEIDSGGNVRAVCCWLYNTPVLTYTPDRLIINVYASITTNQFIDSIGPYWVRAYFRNNNQIIFIQREGEFIGDAYGKIVVPVDDKYMPVHGEVQAAKLDRVVLNRTRANESRKACKGVIALATTTAKMDGYWQAMVSSNEIAPDEDTAWLKGVLKLGGYGVHERWIGGFIHYGFGGTQAATATDLLPHFKRFLYDRQYTRDQCYDTTPAEYGVIPNKYRRV